MTNGRLAEEPFSVKKGDHLEAQDISQSPTGVLFPDTRPEAEAVFIGLLRQAPPWRKLIMVGQLNQAVRTLQELCRRLADLLLGPNLAAQVSDPLGGQEDPDAL
jgi:hypothetical protein